MGALVKRFEEKDLLHLTALLFNQRYTAAVLPEPPWAIGHAPLPAGDCIAWPSARSPPTASASPSRSPAGRRVTRPSMLRGDLRPFPRGRNCACDPTRPRTTSLMPSYRCSHGRERVGAQSRRPPDTPLDLVGSEFRSADKKVFAPTRERPGGSHEALERKRGLPASAGRVARRAATCIGSARGRHGRQTAGLPSLSNGRLRCSRQVGSLAPWRAFCSGRRVGR